MTKDDDAFQNKKNNLKFYIILSVDTITILNWSEYVLYNIRLYFWFILDIYMSIILKCTI